MVGVQSPQSPEKWGIALAVVLLFTLPLFWSAIVVPLSPLEQAAAALAMIGVGILGSFSRPMRPFIIFLSCFASMRYFYWRVSSTVNFGSNLDVTVSLLLLAAELYGFLILLLGYFQTVEMLKREAPSLVREFSVDVFIPTYSEPAEIVRRTVIAAMAIDYPRKKVYVLDDGRRPEIEKLARDLGASYITRSDNEHAKAGNLNNALRLTDGELIAIFDADHAPVRGFLRKTAGFFEDPKVALAQTAQHFFNPDPYERNLNLTGKVAPEQHFFYHVIQPGNDFWNSAFFCGSCAVLRRSALEEIGGFRTETVTEDAHTALELHARGYRSVYLRMPLAAGLATETFAAHVKQRMRWARGMAQILRIDCPLFKRGLSFPQRLNYFNAMLHFFFGIPRLIFILAPLAYLFLGAHPMKTDALSVIAYILPHIGLATIANSMISRRFRHSFWAGVYEVSIAPYTVAVTLPALVSPRWGKFAVTEKGARLEEGRFDLSSSRYTLALFVISLAGLTIAFPLRLFWVGAFGGDPSEIHSILINSAWALGNLIILAAALCVGFEQPQQRRAPRVKRNFPCEIRDGCDVIRGRAVDISESGIRVLLNRQYVIGPECTLAIESNFGVRADVKGAPVRSRRTPDGRVEMAFDFHDLDSEQHRSLVTLIFSGDDGWLAQDYPEDSVARSFWYLLTTPWRATRPRKSAETSRTRHRWQWIEDLR